MQRFLNLVSSSPAKSVNPMDIISDSVTSSSSQDDHPNPVDSLEDLIDSLERPIHSDDNPDEDQEPDFFDHQRGIEGPGTSSTTTTTTVVVVGTSQHAEQEQERQSPSTNESNIRTIVHTLLPTGSIVTEDTLDRLSRAFEIIAKETAKATVSEAISAKISIGSRKATLKPKSAAKRGRGRPPKTGVQAGTKRAAESDEPSKAKRQKAAQATEARPIKYYNKGKSVQVEEPKESATHSKATTSVSEHKGKKVQAKDDEDEGADEAEDEAGDVPEPEYEVESILDHMKRRNGPHMFLIKWKGYDASESTWEAQEMLDGCKELLDNYVASKNLEL